MNMEKPEFKKRRLLYLKIRDQYLIADKTPAQIADKLGLESRQVSQICDIIFFQEMLKTY